MQYVIECRNPHNVENVDFTGPFASRSAAETFLLLPLSGGGLDCQRTHTIHELIAPNEDSISFVTVMRVVHEAQAKAKAEARLELARRTPAFVADNEGNTETLPVTYENLTNYKIMTIKTLRDRFQIGLRESKEIVDDWQLGRTPIRED